MLYAVWVLLSARCASHLCGHWSGT